MSRGSRATLLHISDVHVTNARGAAAEQALVLQELDRDVRQRADFGAPDPDIVLLTGDVAATGGGRKGIEYERAREYLDTILSTVGVDPAHVFESRATMT